MQYVKLEKFGTEANIQEIKNSRRNAGICCELAANKPASARNYYNITKPLAKSIGERFQNNLNSTYFAF